MAKAKRKQEEQPTGTTPFVPVTTRCPRCQRLYVEWFAASEVEGKTYHWIPKVSCDACYAPNASKAVRDYVGQCSVNRRKAMHERYWDTCTKQYLDTVHAEMLKRGAAFYFSHMPDDSAVQPSQEGLHT